MGFGIRGSAGLSAYTAVEKAILFLVASIFVVAILPPNSILQAIYATFASAVIAYGFSEVSTDMNKSI